MLPRIPADVRARLRELRLISRRGSASGGLGQHVSRNRGAGLEFAQYRAYEPGDEPRRIDWKLYARSDRYFVRESERDAALAVWVLIDATASMQQADAVKPAYSKLDAAKALAACIIELAVRQGDRFGIVVASGTGLSLMPQGTGPRHRDRCLLELDGVRASGSWPADAVLRPLWERLSAGSLIVLLSDSFDDAVVDLAERLSAARREVLSIQLLTAEERDFPFRGGRRFVDPETGDELIVDGASVQDAFLERFAAARRALAMRYAASRIRHVEYVLDDALDAPLARFFAARSAEAHTA